MPAGSVLPGRQEASGLHPHLPHQEEQQRVATRVPSQRQRLHAHPAAGSPPASARAPRRRRAGLARPQRGPPR